jgi:hypothetical protein
VGPTNDVNRNSLLRREGMVARRFTTHQSALPTDLVLTFVSTPGGSRSEVMVLPGRMNGLEPGVGFRRHSSIRGPSLTTSTEYMLGLRRAASGAGLL